MKKSVFLSALLLVFLTSCAQEGLKWRVVPMDGSRTGVKACSADNVCEALGTIDDSVYVSPSGDIFRKGSATYSTAAALIASQPRMAHVKKVIAQSTREMSAGERPESPLGNWYIDLLMEETSRLTGKTVHFGVVNFGGIRVDMPKGDVFLDDILSMFPFKNKVCYLELEGRDIRAHLEQFAEKTWQVVGGARCVVRDGRLESVEIDGAPLDDDRVYGVATISFLLNGGDDIFMARNAKNMIILPQYIIDVVLPYVEKLTAEGKPIEYETDGRIKIIKQ